MPMKAVVALIALFFFTACYAQKVILISLDGFRHDYIEKAIAAGKNVSAFQKIAEQGFRAMKVQSVMVSLTFPSHYSLATGRNVEHHGLVGNTFWDPDLKDKYVYTDGNKNLQPEWFTMNKNEPIWLTNQRTGGKSCVFYWPGSDSRMYGEMEYVNYGLYSSVPDLKFRVDRVMDWITKPDVNFCAMYFNEPDSSGHTYGPDSSEVMDAVEKTNEGIAYLLQRIDESDAFDEPPNIIVTSDHGMTTVSKDKVVPVYEKITEADYEFGVDASPATLGVWPKEGKTAEELYDKLKGLANADVYLKKDIPEEYHYKDNKRIAPIVVLPHLGYMVQTNQSKPYADTLKGMHGYNNSKPDMHPFMVAMGPNIRNLGIVDTFYQVDVYTLICLILEIREPNVVDGDVYRVAPFVTNLPSVEVMDQFDRYAKGIDPLPDNTNMLGANLLLISILLSIIQFILRH